MAAPTRSIGQVLEIIRTEFPDISISKIRYLEAEGLLAPERDQPSGYRRYAQTDIDRLRYILRAQRDQYLPLKVIRDHLDQMDQGIDPATSVVVPPAPQTEMPVPVEVATASGRAQQSKRTMRMTRRELLAMSGISEALLIDLERAQVIRQRRGTNHYGREALTIAVAARRLSAYGFDSRHMRVIQQAATHEAGLIEQAMAPFMRQNAAATENLNEVVTMVMHAHSAMLRTLTKH